MTEQQQHLAIQLLRKAGVTVDYWDHKGDLSTRIQDFLKQVVSERDETATKV